MGLLNIICLTSYQLYLVSLSYLVLLCINPCGLFTAKSCLFTVGWGCRIHWLHLCRGVRFPNKCPGYDTKQSDGEGPVTMVLWGTRSVPSLLLLSGPLWPDGEGSVMMVLWVTQSTPSLLLFSVLLWPGVVVPDRVLSMGQIELFEY